MVSKLRKLIQNRRALFVFTACMFCSVLCSAPSVQESVLRYFRMLLKTPQEKVYLQLDKSLYLAGENIWFKGYLVSAVTLKEQDAFSKFIMVELVDRKDSVVLSKKVKAEKGLFYGNLKLDGEFQAGDYYLRSYTNWMRNEDPDFFYSRVVRIGNSVDTEIVAEAIYEPAGANKVRASIVFKQNGAPMSGKVKLTYSVRAGENVIDRGKAITNEDGTLSLEIPFDPETKNERLEVVFADSKYSYKKTFYPYLKSTEYSVTFFPEGGDLLPLPNQVVAFKAQKSNGYSVPVSGKVKNQSGEEVAEFSTLCDGMGAFNLTASKGERFYAEVTSEDGTKKRFDLPEVKPNGMKLVAKRTNSGIAYQVLKDEETPWPDTLYVVAHVRGLLRYMQIINSERNSDIISDSYLRDGIAHLILVDQQGKALSERLVFVKRAQQPVLGVSSDKSSYGRRERVQLTFIARDYNDAPLSGDFGISVTNSDLVPYDSLQGNILSDLLLVSDLKGFVENPGRYFLPSNKRAPAELNLLMLTHGWRRFKCDDFNQLPDSTFQYYVEQGISFTGRVRPLMGSPAGLSVVALANSAGIMLTATTDDKGIFVMQGAEVPDSTQFLVRSRGKNNLPVTVIVDPVDGAVPTNTKIPYPDGQLLPELTEEALNAVRDRFFAEGGVLLRNLKEVTVTGKKNEPKMSDPNRQYIAMADRTMGAEFLDDRRNLTAWDILDQMPGVTLTEGSQGTFFAFQGKPNNMPLLIIDGVTYSEANDYSILQGYSGSEIESISILRYNAAALASLGMNGSNGAFVISTRAVDPLTVGSKANSVVFIPRGYNQSIEFYSPVYNTPTLKAKPEPDLRSTLYWNPKVEVDETGMIQVEYYTDDRNSDHRIIVEGVTTDGRPARIEQRVKMNP